jgi:hypothetical protein
MGNLPRMVIIALVKVKWNTKGHNEHEEHKEYRRDRKAEAVLGG